MTTRAEHPTSRPYPLGATWRDGVLDVAVSSETADAVEVCLFGTAD